MEEFKFGETSLHFLKKGEKDQPVFLWAHGWGQSHESFLKLADSFQNTGTHIFIDFPGFGHSPEPPEAWGTYEYMQILAAFLQQKIKQPVIWVGHSFGCRIGLRMAAQNPEFVQGLFLIAAAGLPKRLPVLKKLYFRARIRIFKILRNLAPTQNLRDWVLNFFGSADYTKASGVMRGTLVKVVNEDLSEEVQNICCPVTLLYGSNDMETPLEIGKRLKSLIPEAEMISLDGQDHYTVLSQGRFPVAKALKNFIERISKEQ